MTAPPETTDESLLYVAVLSPVDAGEAKLDGDLSPADAPESGSLDVGSPGVGEQLAEGVWLVEDALVLLEELQGAELVKFEKDHPRWPKGTPKAGKFMHVGDRFSLGGKDYEIAHILNGKVVAHAETKDPKQAQTIVLDPGKTGVTAGQAAGEPTAAAEPHEKDVVAGVSAASPKQLAGAGGHGKPIHDIATVNPSVEPKTHDASVAIPENSPISPEEWKRFGKIDQENYARLQAKYGKYSPGATKKHLDATYGKYESAVQSLVKSAFQHQYGSSSGWTLSLASLFKGVSKSDLQLQKLHEQREKAKRLQRDVGDAVQWDLYNRTRSPDVVLFHKSSAGKSWWDSTVLSGKQPAFSGLSQSFKFDVNWGFGSTVVMSKVGVRHVTMSSFSAQPVPGASHFQGELEVAIADQLALNPQNTVVFEKGGLPPNHFKWLALSTNQPHGGEMFDQFKTVHGTGAMLPTPPAPASITMDGSEAAGKGYLIDNLPDDFAARVAAVTKNAQGEDIAPVKFSALPHSELSPEGSPLPANQLEFHPGDFMKGQKGALYVIVKDPEDQTGWGWAKVELDPATGKPNGNAFNFGNQGATPQYKLDGHVDLPPPKKADLPEFDPGQWAPAVEQKFLQAFKPGEKFKVSGNAYEVVPGTVPQGFVKVKSLDTGKAGKINGDFKTSPLVQVEQAAPSFALPEGVQHAPNLGPSLIYKSAAGGTTGAAWYESPDGSRWVVKHYDGNADRVATEALANSVLRQVGAKAPETVVTELGGKRVIATKQVVGDVKSGGKWTDAEKKDLQGQFVAHALVANWDAVGLVYDNVIHGPAGSTAIDQGGSFEFRAQGAPKDYKGDAIPELGSLRNAQLNPSAADVFGGVSDAAVNDQAAAIVEHLTPEAIDKLVDSAGFKDKAMADRVREGLKGRLGVLQKMAPGAELGKALKQDAPAHVEPADSLPPAKPTPVTGMVVAYGGKKGTVTKILADGTVQLNLSPGVVKLGPDDPALANLHDPLAYVAEQHKTKLGDLAPGEKFHGGTGQKVKPYQVVSAADVGPASVPKGFDAKKQVLVRNVETGAVAAASKQKAYRKLAPKPADDVAPAAPGTGTATPPPPLPKPEHVPGGFEADHGMVLKQLGVGDQFAVGPNSTVWEVTEQTPHATKWKVAADPAHPGNVGNVGTSSQVYSPTLVKKAAPPSDIVTTNVGGSQLAAGDVFLQNGDQWEVEAVGIATLSATNQSNVEAGFKMFPVDGKFDKIDVEATLEKQSADMAPPGKVEMVGPPPVYDAAEWEASGAAVSAEDIQVGGFFLGAAGTPHVLTAIDKQSGKWWVKNLVTGAQSPADGTVYGQYPAWYPMTKKAVKPDGQVVAATHGFDASKYVEGAQQSIDSMEVGAIFKSPKGGYYQLKSKGAPSGATAVNLVTGKPYPAIKYDKQFAVLNEKQAVVIPHGQLKPGDATPLGNLKAGDKFKAAPFLGGTFQVVTPAAHDDKPGQIAEVGPNGTLGAPQPGEFSQPITFVAHSGLGADNLPMGDPVDATTLIDATDATLLGAGEQLQPYKSSHGPGGAYKHDRIKEMAPGTVFQDKAGKLWKVKQSSGPSAVISDGASNFKVDGKLRGKALDGKQAEGFDDHSPALGNPDDWQAAAVQQNLVPGAGVQLADLNVGDYFVPFDTQTGIPWVVTEPTDSAQFEGFVSATNVVTGDQGVFDPAHAPGHVAKLGTPTSQGEEFKGPEVASPEAQPAPVGTKIEYAKGGKNWKGTVTGVGVKGGATNGMIVQPDGALEAHFVPTEGSWAHAGAKPDELHDMPVFPEHDNPDLFVSASEINDGEFFQLPYQEGTFKLTGVDAGGTGHAVEVASGDEITVHEEDVVLPAVGSRAAKSAAAAQVADVPATHSLDELQPGEQFKFAPESDLTYEVVSSDGVDVNYKSLGGGQTWSTNDLSQDTWKMPGGAKPTFGGLATGDEFDYGGAKWKKLNHDEAALVEHGGQFSQGLGWNPGHVLQLVDGDFVEAAAPSSEPDGTMGSLPVGQHFVWGAETYVVTGHSLQGDVLVDDVNDPSNGGSFLKGTSYDSLAERPAAKEAELGFYGSTKHKAGDLEVGDEFWTSDSSAKMVVTGVHPDFLNVENTETGSPWSADAEADVWSHKPQPLQGDGKIDGSALKKTDQFEWGGDAWTVTSEPSMLGKTFSAKNQATGEAGTFSTASSFDVLQLTSQIEPDSEPQAFEGGGAVPGGPPAAAAFDPADLEATGHFQKVSEMPTGAIWKGKKGGYFQKVGETQVTNKNGQPQKAWVVKDMQTGNEKNTVAFALAGQYYDTYSLKQQAFEPDAPAVPPLEPAPNLSQFNGHFQLGGQVAVADLKPGDHYVVSQHPTNVWKITKVGPKGPTEIKLAWKTPDSNAVVPLGGTIPKPDGMSTVGTAGGLAQTVTPTDSAPTYLPHVGEKIFFVDPSGDVPGPQVGTVTSGNSFLASGNPAWWVKGSQGQMFSIGHQEILGPSKASTQYEVHHPDGYSGDVVVPFATLDEAKQHAALVDGAVVENHPDGGQTVHHPPESPATAETPDVGPAVEFDDATKSVGQVKSGDLFQAVKGGSTFRMLGQGDSPGTVQAQNLQTGEVLTEISKDFTVFGQKAKPAAAEKEALPTVASANVGDYFPTGGSYPVSDLAPGSYFQAADGKVFKLLKHDEEGWGDVMNVATGESTVAPPDSIAKEMDHSVPSAHNAFGPGAASAPTPQNYGDVDRQLVQTLLDAPDPPSQFDAENAILQHLDSLDGDAYSDEAFDKTDQYVKGVMAHFGLTQPDEPDNPFGAGSAGAPAPTADDAAASKNAVKLNTLKPGQKFSVLSTPGSAQMTVLEVDPVTKNVSYSDEQGKVGIWPQADKHTVFPVESAPPSPSSPFTDVLQPYASSYGSGGKYKHEPIGSLASGTRFTDKSKNEYTVVSKAGTGGPSPLHVVYEDKYGAQFVSAPTSKVKILGGAQPKSSSAPAAALTQLEKAAQAHGGLDQIPPHPGVQGYASSHGSGGKYKHHAVSSLPAGTAFKDKGGGTFSVVGNDGAATIVYGAIGGASEPTYGKIPGGTKVKTHGVSSFANEVQPVPKPPKSSSAETKAAKPVKGTEITYQEGTKQWAGWAADINKASAAAGYASSAYYALENYQASGYDSMNEWLRADSFAKIPASTKKEIKLIDEALAKPSAKFHKDSVVYRGVGDLLTIFGTGSAKSLVGTEFHDLGFMSTSTDVEFSAGWGETLLEIHVPKGAKGGYLPTFGFDHAFEGEMLLPRGSKFKITAAGKHTDKYGHTKTKLVLELIP